MWGGANTSNPFYQQFQLDVNHYLDSDFAPSFSNLFFVCVLPLLSWLTIALAALAAQTLGLDVHSLFERAADAQFARGLYARALALYRRSNVRLAKLARKFLAVGARNFRMHAVCMHVCADM